jgi:sulfur dioxygenase
MITCASLRPHAVIFTILFVVFHRISIQKGSLERLDRKQHDLKKVYVNSVEKIRNEIKSKKNSIANLKSALKRLTSHDCSDEMISDIDLRIRQAEIEFALGREEIELMELLSKLEEIKKIQQKMESDGFGPFDESLYGRITKGEQIQVCAVQATTGRWNANVLPDREGLYIDWVMDGEELQRGDLIIEINGKIISGHDKEELQRSCSNNAKCEMVVLRRMGDAKKHANQMQTENVRLRHRISYLEEQVKELASNHKNETHITSISIQSQPSDDNRPLIYQRGSYVATIPQIQKSSSTTSVNLHQHHHSNHHHNNNNNHHHDMNVTPSSVKSSMKSLSASLSRISVSTDANLQKYRREREKRDIRIGSGSQKR